MTSRIALSLALGLGFAALAPVISTAQDNPRVRAACTADARRLCPRYKDGTSELRYCMESRGRALSHGCVRALEDAGVVPRGTLQRGRN